MTSRPRFPVGLTLGAAVVFVVCCGLGVWQLQRAQWKTHELARIEAVKAEDGKMDVDQQADDSKPPSPRRVTPAPRS